jgi:replicative DNA helicase
MNSEILDRLPPQDVEAEKGVLGSILLDPELTYDVSLILRPDDFYSDANRRLYGHVLAMHDARQRIDTILLMNRLVQAGEVEAVGGAAYIYELFHKEPYAANAVYYAKIVREKSILRAIIHASTESLREAYQGTIPSQTILDHTEQRLQAVGEKRGSELATATELAVEVGDYIDKASQQGNHLGLPTGLYEFDERIGGLFGGELIILAARTQVGKSALSAQIADYSGSAGRLTYVVTLEMTGRELATRTICNICSVNSQRIRTGKITPEDRGRLAQGMAEFSQRKIILDKRFDVTAEAISRTVRRLVRDGLQLVVVDYLGFVTPTDTRVKRYEQVSHQTKVFKALARETGVCVMILCQLNRETMQEKGAPQLHHLRESGSLEQDADMVLFIHRPDEGIMIANPDERSNVKQVKAEWPAELIVAKNRNGTTGRIKLAWEPIYTRFSCWNKQNNYDPSLGEHDGSDRDNYVE